MKGRERRAGVARDGAEPAQSMQAVLLGRRIRLRGAAGAEALSPMPLTLRAGARGYAFLFRFGVVVLVGVAAGEREDLLARVAPLIEDPFAEPEEETADLAIDPERGDRVDADGRIVLRDASLERLQVVAEVLAKSTVLAHYEERVARVFDDVERIARELAGRQPGRIGRGELLREIGEVLLIQTETVGRVEVSEKPEITWDRPELDRLYERLAVEYELRERDVALARKLEVIARTAQTYHDLLQHRQTLRVEWYIVALIAVEIVLLVWDLLGPG